MSEFGDGRDQKIKIPEVKVDSAEIIFGVDVYFDEHVGSLEEACNVGNFDEVRKLLLNNKFIENVVIRKGKNKELLALLERAVNNLVQQEIGKNVSEISDVKELERVIKSGKLPPFAIAELAGAFYHLINRDGDSERLASLVSRNESGLIDKVSRANAFNTLGSLYFRGGDVRGSEMANKAGLDLLPKEGGNLNERWQISKLKYGLVIDKMEHEVFPDIPDQLFDLKREREKLGDIFNISRVDLDAARSCKALGMRDRAIRYALDAKDGMAATGYWSGATQAEELLNTLIKKKKKR